MINLNSLLKLSTVKRFAKDAVILQEGVQYPAEMLIILAGSVGVYKGYGTPLQKELSTLGPGGFVGEMMLFVGRMPDSTAVSLGDTIAVAINKQNAGELFVTQPELTYNMIEAICKKLGDSQDAYAQLINDVRAGVAAKKLQEAEQTGGTAADLFPEGHGSYNIGIDNTKSDYIYEDTVTCPLCGHTFKNLALITSRLRRESTDPDMRVHYKDIEPLHYDVITCPSCLFSATGEQFKGASKTFAAQVVKALAGVKSGVVIKPGYERDSFTVFAGYYLALLCAPICFDEYQLIQAGLWQKIGRLYSDAGDAKMYDYASRQCLKEYLYSYEHFRLSEKQMQHITFVLGDLYQRLGDLDKARNFFYMAKTNRDGVAVMSRQADLRLDQIREIMQAQKQQG